MTIAYISSGSQVFKICINWEDISTAKLIEMLNSHEAAINLHSNKIYIPPKGGAEGYAVIGEVIREIFTSQPWRIVECPPDED